MTKRLAILPGTFAPPTLGHLDLIQRAAALFDTLYIGIAENVRKANRYFTAKERLEMVEIITKDIPQVEIITFDGLVAEYCLAHKIPYIIRGLRGESDFSDEFQMAAANKQMSGVETFFMFANPKYMPISSSLIQEIAHFGHRLNGFVPESIETFAFEKIRGNGQGT